MDLPPMYEVNIPESPSALEFTEVRAFPAFYSSILLRSCFSFTSALNAALNGQKKIATGAAILNTAATASTWEK